MQQILLLDPDPERRQRLAFLLRHSGFIVELGESGMGGIARLRQMQPDMVLIAERCTAMQDYDAAQLVFRLFANVPKIVLGEESEEVAGIPYLERGADAYLPRPLDTRVLLARVRSMLYRLERKPHNDCETCSTDTPCESPCMPRRGTGSEAFIKG